MDLAKRRSSVTLMRSFSGVLDRNRFMRGQQERIGKCEKKRMMNRIIVNSKIEMGKISRSKNAFTWALERPAIYYVCIFMYSCKSSQHAATSVGLGHQKIFPINRDLNGLNRICQRTFCLLQK